MKKTLEPYQLIERSIIKKYRKELWTPFIVAVKRYELVQAGDRDRRTFKGLSPLPPACRRHPSRGQTAASLF